MKNVIIQNYFLLLFLIIAIQAIEPTDKTEKTIQNIEVNSNQVVESLNQFKIGQFIYFSFDVDKFKKISKNYTSIYFKISTKQKFYINSILSKSLSHVFINKTKNITYSDIESNQKKFNWQKSKLLYKTKDKASNQTMYYIAINKVPKKPTLIIRIPILQIDGDVKIQNTLALSIEVKRIIEAPAKSIAKGLYHLIHSMKSIKNKTYETKDKNNMPKNNNNRGYEYNINKYNDNNNNRGYEYNKNKYNDNNNDYKYRKKMKRNAFRKNLGAILLSIWGTLVLLYFLVNRRKKIFYTRKVEFQNLNSYMNI